MPTAPAHGYPDGTDRIGADLTAVVTGTPSAPLAALLDLVADRETSGTASVWRFSPGSVRRALDAGHSPDELTADLGAVAAGPLRNRAPRNETTAKGRRPRTDPRRGGAGVDRRSAVRHTATTPTAADPNALAARLLTAPDPDPFGSGVPFGTDTEEIVAGHAKRLPYTDVRQLAHAIDTGTRVTVEYVATSGNRTVRTLSRLELDPPYLEAWCHLREDERVFTPSRIHSIMPS
ncbi:helicase-associated domain-containing protein [Streptomyces sp. NPDC002133]|uniref:helicase-associated domain-containing protein n=1 Tax=Streptomyces sp. NPDC002133 TaxID=3154409 RepID=UPI00332A0D25